MEMAKVYTPSIPRTWAKPRLADIIVDGQDGINSIPGAPTYTKPPYSERTIADTVYIQNHEEGYTRRVRQKLDAHGGLSSSLQFKTKYGTTTVVTRILRTEMDEYHRDLAAGTAGLTGQLMDTAGNSGIQTLAAAFLHMHNTPASIVGAKGANGAHSANAVAPAAPSRKRQRLPSPPPEAVMYPLPAYPAPPAHAYATGFAPRQEYSQAYRVPPHQQHQHQQQHQQKQHQPQRQPLHYRPYPYPLQQVQQLQQQQHLQIQQYPLPTPMQYVSQFPQLPQFPHFQPQHAMQPSSQLPMRPPVQQRFSVHPSSSPPYTSTPVPLQALVSSGPVSSPNRHKPLPTVTQPVIIID